MDGRDVARRAQMRVDRDRSEEAGAGTARRMGSMGL